MSYKYVTNPGERVLIIAKCSPFILMFPIMCIVTGIILLEYTSDWKLIAGLLLLFYGLVMIVRAIYRLLTTRVVVTSNKIIMRAGLLSSQCYELKLGNVEGLSIHKPFWGKLFNYGTVQAAVHGSSIRCPYIASPYLLRETIYNNR